MKLKNKNTGEIGWLYCDHISVPKKMVVFSEDKDLSAHHWDYASLVELTKEWEDAPEPKGYFYIRDGGNIDYYRKEGSITERHKSIGNYFNTREEAEKAVEKLKAWKRLKDNGFRFKYWTYKMDEPEIENHTHFMIVGVCEDGVRFDDLDLLFGGKE